MSRLFCGIDPGLNGGVGFIDDGGAFVAVHDMPTLPTPTGRRQVDPAALAEMLRQHGPAFVLVERVGSRPGEGVVSAFSFGQGFGCILGVLGALALPHDLVHPATWKRRAGIPPKADKGVSIATAKRLLPAASPHLGLVKHDGRAESLLLAVHGWQTRTTEHERK